jgi:competence protein ComEC
MESAVLAQPGRMFAGSFDDRRALGPLLAIALVAGTAAGLSTPVSWVDAAALALVCASVALVPDTKSVRLWLGLAAMMAAGAGHGAAVRDRALAPPLVQWLDGLAGAAARAPGPVTVRGRLAADAARTDFGVRLVIEVHDVDPFGAHVPAGGRVQAYVTGDLAVPRVTEWTSGRTIRAAVALRRPQVLLNPGGLGPIQQALRRPFHLAGTIKSAALIEVEPGRWWDEAAAAVRRHVRNAVSRHVRGDQQAAIVTAILIGDRAGLSDDVERRLQTAGTYHVIAISGGNVALLVLMTIAVLRLTVRRHRAASLIALGLVLAYGQVVGGDPSVRRAVAAAAIYLAMRAVGLVPRAVHVLATVAALAVAIDPLATLDVGAWLSFGATFGIVLYAGRFGKDLADRVSGSAGRLPRSCFTLLGATLAAELALMPIGAAVFSRVSLAGLVLNFVAIPAMAVVQLAGMGVVIGDTWRPDVSAVAGRVASLAAAGLVDSASLVDVAPWLSWRVPPSPAAWSVAYYAAWAVALWPSRGRSLRRTCLIVAAIATAVIATAPEVERAGPGHRLRVTLIDVGQGDAIAVQFPGGQSLLVDTGGTPGPFDIGGRVVTPSLWALGIRRLDWLAITHADADHIGGARAVLSDLAPREVWEGVPVPRSPELQRLRADARARGASWRTLVAGDRLEAGGTIVAVAHPPPPDWERQKVRNDDSIVLRLVYGQVEFLLTGDAGIEFEGRHPTEYTATPLRILKVGHHGSRTSSSQPFLDALRPQIALISAGRTNLFGHPAPDVLSRLERVDARIFRTDLDAAIVVETDGRTVDVRSLGGRTWQLRTSAVPSR